MMAAGWSTKLSRSRKNLPSQWAMGGRPQVH